jgi:hypothetical protein
VARGAVDLVRERRIARHEPTPIRDVETGLHLLRGRVVAEGGAMLEAPLSGTPCVLAHSRIADLEGTIVQRTTSAAFAIEDASGRARIIAEEGSAQLAVARRWTRSVAERDLDARAQAMMRPGYTVAERGRRERTVELCEWLVFPDDEVFVLGFARLEADAAGLDRGFREPPMRITLRGGTRQALVISDADRPSLRRAALGNVTRGAGALCAAAMAFAMGL